MDKHNVVIIGSGPGGYAAALHASRLGASPLLIEKEQLGGTCLARGCIPTKSLLASAGLLQEVKGAKEFGVEVGSVEANFNVMMQRKEKVVRQLTGGLGMLLKSWGVDIMTGNARFIDSHTIEVSGSDGVKEVKSDRIIVATGSEPSVLKGVETDGKAIINSNHILQLDRVPSSLLIIGGGVIGMEFASIFNALGTRVTLVELLPGIIPFADEEVSKALEKSLVKAGIDIRTGAVVEGVSVDGVYQKAMIKGPDGAGEVVVEKTLVAVGRSPYTEGLELENAGIKTVKGNIPVNEKMETEVKGVYAIGDVTGGTLLAHVASEEGMVAVENALGRNSVIDYSVIASCVYCMPQVAGVGVTEKSAGEKGIEFSTGRFPFTASAKGLILSKRDGFIKVIAEKKTGKIMGVHIIGHEATELIAEAAIAIKTGATTKSFTRISHAHPSLHEAMLDVMDDVNDESIGLARKKK